MSLVGSTPIRSRQLSADTLLKRPRIGSPHQDLHQRPPPSNASTCVYTFPCSLMVAVGHTEISRTTVTCYNANVPVVIVHTAGVVLLIVVVNRS